MDVFWWKNAVILYKKKQKNIFSKKWKKVLTWRGFLDILSKQSRERLRQAPVAQLDRVFGYEPKGRGFESLTARQYGATILHHNKKVLEFQGLFWFLGKNLRNDFMTVPREPSGLELSTVFHLKHNVFMIESDFAWSFPSVPWRIQGHLLQVKFSARCSAYQGRYILSLRNYDKAGSWFWWCFVNRSKNRRSSRSGYH